MCLQCGFHGARNSAHKLLPFRLLLEQLLFAESCDFVKLCAAVGFRNLPFGGEPPAALQPMERRIKRAVFYLESVFRTDPDCLADSMAMLRAPQQGLENQEIEGPLKKIDAAGGELRL